jgi:tetratricopeptide (TPR) repeat protein
LLLILFPFFLEESKLSEAVEVLSAAIATQPASAALFYARGEIREKSKLMRDALMDYSRALQIQPRPLGALLGRARLAGVAQRHAISRHDALAVLKICKGHSEALLLAAQAEEGLGNAMLIVRVRVYFLIIFHR